MDAPPPDLDEVILVPKGYPLAELEDAILASFRRLRLHGLQIDPQAFSSTYEKESQFFQHVWRSRINNPASKTFAAVTNSSNQPDASRAEAIIKSYNCSREIQELVRKEWVGVVALLGPEVFSWPGEGVAAGFSHPYKVFIKDGRYHTSKDISELGDLSGAHLVYMMTGMFVTPATRRRGLGQRLMEAAIAAATEEARTLGAHKVSITLQVGSGSLGAKRLYERVGFKMVDEEKLHGGRLITVTLEMEVDLSIVEEPRSS